MTGQHSYEQALPTSFKLVGGLHNYIVEQVLGQGGFGITYKVKTRIKTGNIGIDAYFAVKEFFPSGCWRNPGSTEMQYAPTSRKEVEACLKDFITEGQRLQQMCQLNTNIVNVNEVFEANGTAYFVMEYLDGGDIRQMVRNNGGPLSEKTMLSILTPIADAVRTLHYNNMLHLDIKPENIVMRKGYDDTPDVPVLIDFGIAVHFSEDGSPTTTRPSKGVTQGYSPIEQFAGITRFDPRIDIYALSATAYFMLAGKDPHSAFDITSQEISNSLVGRASQNTINALLHGMSQHYSYRTTTVDELLAELMPPVNPIMPESFDDPDTSDYTTRGFYMQGSYDNDVNQAYSGMTAYEAPIPAAQPRDKGKKRKTILITAAIVGAALIGLAIWGIISTSKGNNDKKLEALLNDTTFSQELLEFAENGNDEAQNILAFCYKDGKGVTKDSIKAVEWWKKAAEQNNAEAQHRLGHAYQDGEGVEKDDTKAFEWFKKAAEQNHPRAQNDLGSCYYYGRGVTLDYKQAINWYNKAAEQNSAVAQNYLGVCYSRGEGVKKDMTQAVFWYQKAAEQGNSYGQFNLGYCYEKGEGVTKNLSKAIELYQKAADQGNSEAQVNLGYCYDNGQGVSKNPSKAVEWYRKAAEQGNSYGQNNLGSCYFDGRGVNKDYKQAIEWYKKAAAQGHSDAQNSLGDCYYDGTGVNKDYKQAVEWYKKAAAQGNSDAQYNLGWAYENGEGIKKDMTQAIAWYRKAAAQGHADAKTALRELGY